MVGKSQRASFPSLEMFAAKESRPRKLVPLREKGSIGLPFQGEIEKEGMVWRSFRGSCYTATMIQAFCLMSRGLRR